MANEYIPTQQHEILDALQRLYQMHYALRDKVNTPQPSPKLDVAKPAQPAGGPSNTTITGIPVKSTPPADGDTIRFRKTSGDFEFGP